VRGASVAGFDFTRTLLRQNGSVNTTTKDSAGGEREALLRTKKQENLEVLFSFLTILSTQPTDPSTQSYPTSKNTAQRLLRQRAYWRRSLRCC
jgi:hypothetical protein